MVIHSNKIRRIREEKGILVKDIAEKLNISRSTVWAWENNKRKPTMKNLKALSEMLGVSLIKISNYNIDSFVDEEKPELESIFKKFSGNIELNNISESIETAFLSIKDNLTEANMILKKSSLVLNAFINHNSIMVYIKDINSNYLIANNSFIKNIVSPIYQDIGITGRSDNVIFKYHNEAKKNFEEDHDMMSYSKNVYECIGFIPGTNKIKQGYISKSSIKDENNKVLGLLGIFIPFENSILNQLK